MRQSLRITFRGMEPSATMEDRIRDLAARLEHFCDNIIGCHVVVEEVSHRHRHGNPFNVRVALHVTGRDIVAESQRAETRNQVAAGEALDEAFERAERQLIRHIDHLQVTRH